MSERISDERIEEIWRQIDRKADDAHEQALTAHESIFRDTTAALRELQQLRQRVYPSGIQP